MYGYTPIENFLDVIGVKKEFRMSANELIEIFNRFPLDRLWTVRIGDFFLSTVFDSDDLYDLRARQMGKDFYIPSVAEVEELFGFPVYSIADVYDILEYLAEDEKNAAHIARIKAYLSVNGAKA